MSAARAFLAALRREVQEHAAVGHSVLGRMHADPRTREDFRVLGEQHYPLVGCFTRYLECLLLSAPDPASKLWMARVLVDEYGERSAGADHAELYRRFLRAAGVAEGGELRVPLHPAVVEFIAEHLRICSQEPFLVGLGAVGPGHEWAIPAMFPHLLAGLRKAGFAEEDIVYFTCHIEQDVDHGLWMEQALERFAGGEAEQEQVRRGARMSLAARERFWWGVADKLLAGPARRRGLPGSTRTDGEWTLQELQERLRVRLALAQEGLPGKREEVTG